MRNTSIIQYSKRMKAEGKSSPLSFLLFSRKIAVFPRGNTHFSIRSRPLRYFSFGLPISPAMSENTIAAAIPADEAVRAPVRMPGAP